MMDNRTGRGSFGAGQGTADISRGKARGSASGEPARLIDRMRAAYRKQDGSGCTDGGGTDHEFGGRLYGEGAGGSDGLGAMDGEGTGAGDAAGDGAVYVRGDP